VRHHAGGSRSSAGAGGLSVLPDFLVADDLAAGLLVHTLRMAVAVWCRCGRETLRRLFSNTYELKRINQLWREATLSKLHLPSAAHLSR
jgi:hypothetical protein